MHIVAFNGSPRRNGNTSAMLAELLRGARDAGAAAVDYRTSDLRLRDCRGCLRCNVLRRCSLRGDDWAEVSAAILRADALVFASPVYFQHVTASMKRLLDRFRSFMHVQITADGLRHTPWHAWNTRFMLLMCMGSPDAAEARPACDLFSYVARIFGPDNGARTILATRLAAAGQIRMPEEQLMDLYVKLRIPAACAADDAVRNREILAACYRAGLDLGHQG